MRRARDSPFPSATRATGAVLAPATPVSLSQCRHARDCHPLAMIPVARTLRAAVSPQARASYLALYSIGRGARALSTRSALRSSYNRSDFSGQGFTSLYETDQPTRGPLGGTSSVGASLITPKGLKQHLDQFVVDQERAKIVLSVAIHEHHLRVQELRRQKEDQARLEAQAQRRASVYRHPVEDEFPGQQATVEMYNHHEPSPYHESHSHAHTPYNHRVEPEPLLDTVATPIRLDKANVLILGPTGVGKTLMCKTLARSLGIPISMSDCTTFTSAGYIGDDVEQCVHRLFTAANHDIEATEQGVIVLDEIDKIANAKVSHGKDVGGEGVQQALLKIIEGTTVQCRAKPEKNAGRSPGGLSGSSGGLSGGPGGKEEIFNVRTDNILFICTGAFANLHKIVLDRKSMGGMGFGASIRSSNTHAAADGVMLKGADALIFKKDSPFFVPPEAEDQNPVIATKREDKVNVLDHVQPSDLQKYGMIPELIGRIPTMCAVSALDEEALVRVLTEPKDSLLRQEEHKFFLRNIELRFTSGALREIARKASKMGTGARGLRHVVDQLLLQAKYETPGSTVKHILVTQHVALLKCAPVYFYRGQSIAFQDMVAQEEERWDEEVRSKEDASINHVTTLEEYRKAGAAGS
ncbi:P-loop containing nucleoside triphosphate hydrolase protein [Dothidotthia symphoricarpi CBS 119687]|uniref:P-loop containing nucleoside triphosphate hydrolase protein n=1 Tax=Dothidotthia symphoricarpi CBS 119687 TaxID=1392245 RepID=A0A6A6AAT9_9PLEO|nr:P-loop containing nucleoside triphosphate hydrolase protein [Dothidotthia symphoricarpi CBS 119687]KAF2129042.1 P-loop containing nucleoside triphosphate hydrolase protein [Dothidotthia symphoricarpi CBS 119687]